MHTYIEIRIKTFMSLFSPIYCLAIRLKSFTFKSCTTLEVIVSPFRILLGTATNLKMI